MLYVSYYLNFKRGNRSNGENVVSSSLSKVFLRAIIESINLI